jgi:hypothetical protein
VLLVRPVRQADLNVDRRSATGALTDPYGCEVVLLARIWEEKIARDHPELVDYLEAVMETFAKPDHVEPDPLPARRGLPARCRPQPPADGGRKL